MHAGKYDYQLIPCVCRLARQSRVVGGLSELDMPDDEPTTIPGAVTVRVFHLLHNQISRKVDRIDCRRRPALILEQEIAVALEESAAFLSISKIPGNVASLINEFRWPTNLDDEPRFELLNDRRELLSRHVPRKELRTVADRLLDLLSADRSIGIALPKHHEGHRSDRILN